MALAESAIKGKIGCTVKINSEHSRVDGILFSEAPSRVIASVKRSRLDQLVQAVVEHEVEMRIIGHVGGDRLVIEDDGSEIIRMTVGDAARRWGEAIEWFMK